MPSNPSGGIEISTCLDRFYVVDWKSWRNPTKCACDGEMFSD
jgi:hypothetical protein